MWATTSDPSYYKSRWGYDERLCLFGAKSVRSNNTAECECALLYEEHE